MTDQTNISHADDYQVRQPQLSLNTMALLDPVTYSWHAQVVPEPTYSEDYKAGMRYGIEQSIQLFRQGSLESQRQLYEAEQATQNAESRADYWRAMKMQGDASIKQWQKWHSEKCRECFALIEERNKLRSDLHHFKSLVERSLCSRFLDLCLGRF